VESLVSLSWCHQSSLFSKSRISLDSHWELQFLNPERVQNLGKTTPIIRRLAGCGPDCCLSVSQSSLSFCVQHYCKSNQLISLKLGTVIGPTSRKNWLTFGGDPVSDTDSGSLFHIPHHCGMGDFRRFISISRTVTGRFSRHLAK